jgi:hypothetical protein
MQILVVRVNQVAWHKSVDNLPEKIVEQASDLELLILNSDFAEFEEQKGAHEVLIEVALVKGGKLKLKLLTIFDFATALDEIMGILGPIRVRIP